MHRRQGYCSLQRGGAIKLSSIYSHLLHLQGALSLCILPRRVYRTARRKQSFAYYHMLQQLQGAKMQCNAELAGARCTCLPAPRCSEHDIGQCLRDVQVRD